MKNNTLVVNLFGGPGTGKSTMCSAVFSSLKFRGVNCEIAPEFAKEKVWEKSLFTLQNQIYIFGKQHHSVFRLLGQVKVIITDSPLLLSLVYGNNNKLNDLVLYEVNKCNNYNIFLKREKKYNPSGRLQNESEAIKIDSKIKSILNNNSFEYDEFNSNICSVDLIVGNILNRIEI